MILFLLDTNMISHASRDPTGALAMRLLQEADRLCTSIIAAAEIRFGLAKRSSPALTQAVETLLDSIPIQPFEAPADFHYAAIRCALERAGNPIGANDLLIAAHALALDCTLVTDNEREFRRVPGLKVENWLR